MTPPKESPDLQIVTYNVQREWHRESILSDIATLFKQHISPDLMMFQEARVDEKGVSPLIEGIREVIGKQLEYIVAPYDHEFLGIREALITAWDPTKMRLVDTSKNTTPIPSLSKNPLIERIKNGNLSPVQRITQILRFRLCEALNSYADNPSLNDVLTANVHFDCYGSESHKATQLREVLRQLIRSEGQTTFLVGDFNTNSIRPGNAYPRYSLIRELIDRVMLKRLEDAEKTMHAGTPYAAPKETFARIQRFMAKIRLHWRQKLDFIFGSNAESLHSEILPVGGSDHFPLYSAVRLRPDPQEKRVRPLTEM